jgi:hypothetical protein
MENKVSDTLLSLSAKAKSVEDKISTARTEAKEKLDARIAKSKTELEKKKKDFISKAETVMTNAETKNSSLKESINQKIKHLKAEAKAKKEAVKTTTREKKHEFDVHRAEADYNEAVAYAENCIEWAIVDLGNVETATLEAFAAKLRLDDLKKTKA